MNVDLKLYEASTAVVSCESLFATSLEERLGNEDDVSHTTRTELVGEVVTHLEQSVGSGRLHRVAGAGALLQDRSAAHRKSPSCDEEERLGGKLKLPEFYNIILRGIGTPLGHLVTDFDAWVDEQL